MAGGNGGNRPLVADKRYAASRSAAPKPTPAKPTSAKPAPRRPAPKRGFLGRLFFGTFGFLFRLICATFWRGAAVGAVILGTSTAYFFATLPEVTALLDARAKGSVTLLDRHGTVFAWRGETFGGQITADTVSPHLKNAVIATEDKRFYGHFGISPRGIASAIRINMSEGRRPFEGNGGSTITQQVAKLLCLGEPYDPAKWKTEADYESYCRGGGMWRKIKEIPYSVAMEVKYSKEEILTIYFNRAYLGAGARGFEAAAQRYFGVSANQVDPAQSAMLAGLLKAPSKYAPTNSLQRAQDRANVIVGLMEDQGYLDAVQADEARKFPARLSKAAEAKAGGAFADWVMETIPDFLAKDTTEDVVVHTTLDQDLQIKAQDALDWVFENKVSDGSKAQAAIVVMDADGAVRAMVGGRQTEGGGTFNRATQALRQTGSSFKPFVYAAAMDLGWTPLDYVEDTPLTIDIPGSGPWTPKNYDNEFKGMMTMSQALAESRNIPAVRVSEAVGRDRVQAVAMGFGIDTKLADGPALALGASESTLITMTGAYAGILNGGSSVAPYGLMELRLKGEDEALMGAAGGIGERVITPDAAAALTYMMWQVVEQGTGTRARLEDRPSAGKTGTTTAGRDAWYIGFTADHVTGVWMGYDDNTPLKGVTGGGLPAQIWHEVMVRIEAGLPVRDLPMALPQAVAPPLVDPMIPGQDPGYDGSWWNGETGQVQSLDEALEDVLGGAPPPLDPVEALLREILGSDR